MAKKAIAYLVTPADVIAMLVFKAGFRFLPQKQKDVLASIPIKAMKFDGEQFQELREKYFKQKANEVKGFVGTSKMVKEGLRMRLMDARRTAILGKEAPNFEGTYAQCLVPILAQILENPIRYLIIPIWLCIRYFNFTYYFLS